MAKVKANACKKRRMSLTVSDQTRLELAFISERCGESVSSLVKKWAYKEVKAICKRTGEEFPRVEQLTIDDLEDV